MLHHSMQGLLEPLFTALLLPPCSPFLPPIILAAGRGDTREVRRLVEQEDVNINEKDVCGRTALIHAIIHGPHFETVQLLLEEGATADDSNHDTQYSGWTPLTDACKSLWTYSGLTPLIHASHCGHFDTVRLLLEHGGARNINDKTNLGSTALSIASFHGNFLVACLLLHHGADPCIAANNGKTPADLAKGECKRIDWNAFMKDNMITPSNLSSIVIAGGTEPEHQVDATINEQERGDDPPLTREMIQAMLHEQQEALIRQHKEAFDAMRQQQELAMASIRQENASIREMLHVLIQQPHQQQQKEFLPSGRHDAGSSSGGG
jgi:Ankyrin repeats (3 copies)